MPDQLTRRTALAAAAFSIVPRHVIGATGTRKAPSDQLNLAGIGVGGVGSTYLEKLETENIVALCDVDPDYAAKKLAKYPKATVYRDFRVLLENEKNIDAVVIGTPDHTHAVIAMAAMRLGKHVYCAKPLARTIADTRLLARTAREQRIVTQMSVQSSASDLACSTIEWVQADAVGAVREVHVWTDRPVWPQAVVRPGDTPVPPSTFDWDIWLGPVPARAYHPIYHPFNWRGWHDFGTGALGDMGCHTLHILVRALDLTSPTSVSASSVVLMEATDEDPDEEWMRARKTRHPETFPAASIVTWDFPARGALPPVRVTWYEAGLKPPRPQLPASGILFIGEHGELFSRFSGGPRLLTESRMREWTPPAKTLPRVTDHYKEWADAVKGGPAASCNWEFGALLTETTLLGSIAQRTGATLTWDAEAMKFPNSAEASQFLSAPPRAGWSF
jgi:predicted dehydrogenase